MSIIKIQNNNNRFKNNFSTVLTTELAHQVRALAHLSGLSVSRTIKELVALGVSICKQPGIPSKAKGRRKKSIAGTSVFRNKKTQ